MSGKGAKDERKLADLFPDPESLLTPQWKRPSKWHLSYLFADLRCMTRQGPKRWHQEYGNAHGGRL